MVHESMWIPVGIPIQNDPTMTVAIINGDPLPPEPTDPSPFNWDNLFAEDESEHPDASFNLPLQISSTQHHIPTAVAISNGCTFSDHEPTTMPRPLLKTLSDPTTCKIFISLTLPPQHIDLAAFAARIHTIPLYYLSHSNQAITMMMMPMTTKTNNKGISMPSAPTETTAFQTANLVTQYNISKDFDFGNDDKDFPMMEKMMTMMLLILTPLTPTQLNSSIPSPLDMHLPTHSAAKAANDHDDDFLMTMTMMTMLMMTIFGPPQHPYSKNWWPCNNNCKQQLDSLVAHYPFSLPSSGRRIYPVMGNYRVIFFITR